VLLRLREVAKLERFRQMALRDFQEAGNLALAINEFQATLDAHLDRPFPFLFVIAALLDQLGNPRIGALLLLQKRLVLADFILDPDLKPIHHLRGFSVLRREFVYQRLLPVDSG
jgi:hypothetical protein